MPARPINSARPKPKRNRDIYEEIEMVMQRQDRLEVAVLQMGKRIEELTSTLRSGVAMATKGVAMATKVPVVFVLLALLSYFFREGKINEWIWSIGCLVLVSPFSPDARSLLRQWRKGSLPPPEDSSQS